MRHFIAKYADRITGVLSGFDRLVFRGHLRQITFPDGLKRLLWKRQVLLKDFGPFALKLTSQLKDASLGAAQQQGRPVVYLHSSHTDKEAIARKIAQQDGVTSGLVAVLTCLELCRSFEIYRNRETKRLELVSRPRKGLYYYRDVSWRTEKIFRDGAVSHQLSAISFPIKFPYKLKADG